MSLLASGLQVFGSINVVEKGTIWRNKTVPFFILFPFHKERQNADCCVVPAFFLTIKSPSSQDGILRKFQIMERCIQFL